MRGSSTDPNRSPGHRRARRSLGALATAALLLPLLGAAPAESPTDSSAATLQRAFASASAEYHVPRTVLLAVSYLQSRWDTHGGAPSVTGGYGPMHLTDARTALAATEHLSEGSEDPRGDSARAALHPTAQIPADSQLPARLRTLTKAAELTGLPATDLRTDETANVCGGAALLADAQKGLGEPLSTDPAEWYGAIARFSGADDTATAAAYANDVYDVIHSGEARTTDAGQQVALAAQPDLAPDTAQLRETGLRTVSMRRYRVPQEGVLRVDPGAVLPVRGRRLRQPRPGRPARVAEHQVHRHP